MATLPNDQQALARYSFNAQLLQQDSLADNYFHAFSMAGHRAYELTIGNEVLVRVLAGPYVVDMQFHICATIAGDGAQAVVRPIADRLQLPILTTSQPPSTPHAQ